MKMHTSPAARQRGFSILTGFILAIVMFGSLAFFLAGRGINTGFGSTYTNTSKVSALLASASYIATGFDAVTLNGTLPTAVLFDSTATTGIFNPDSGGASPQPLDPSLFQLRAAGPSMGSLDGYFIYRKNGVILNSIGTGTGEYTIIVSGLKQAICEKINFNLHGSTTIPSSGLNDSVLVGDGTTLITAPTFTGAADLSAVAGTVAWMNGCYQSGTAGTGNYVYVHTLLAQ